MKFSFTSYIAQEAFLTLATGEKLFRFGIPFGKPYIVPNFEIEKRLLQKTINFVKIYFSGMFLTLLIVSMLQIDVLLTIIIFFVVAVSLFLIIYQFLFKKETSKLQRFHQKITLKATYISIAKKHGYFSITTSLFTTILFSGIAIWALPLSKGWSKLGLWVIIFLMIYSVIMWSYILFIKVSSRTRQEA